MKSETITFATTGDFELGLGHAPRETDYTIYHPDKAPKGLVVFVPGFGEDAGGYRQVLTIILCTLRMTLWHRHSPK